MVKHIYNKNLATAFIPICIFLNVQILSKDSVTVAVDAVVYYRVFNPTVAIANVENFR